MSVTTSAQAPAPLAATRAAAAPAGLPTRPSARPDPSYSEIVRFLSAEAAAQRHGPGRLYAALADITPAATSVTDITSVPQWLGEVWSGRMYRQRYLPLLTHRPLTNMEIRGWRWKTKPEVDDWAGEKADVPTGPAATEPYTLSAYRIAGAHDIDRIFRDFNVNEFWDGYWSAMTESYARKADTKAKDEIVAGAGANYVTPGAVPDGVATAAAYIVDGALAVIDVATPDFALVSKDLYRELLLTRADDVVAYLTMALGLEEGSIEDFRIVPFNDATTDTVIVGAAGAATVYELPGVPIRVEALDVAKGGIDVGLFGYMTVGTNDSTGMALVSGTAPAAAPVPQSTTTKTTKTTTKS